MKKITANGKTFIFISAPRLKGIWRIDKQPNQYGHYYFHLTCQIDALNSMGLALIYNHFGGRKNYPENLTFMATTDEVLLSEELASMIAENNGMGCWENYSGKPDNRYTCRSATESFACLLRERDIKHSVVLTNEQLQTSLASIIK